MSGYNRDEILKQASKRREDRRPEKKPRQPVKKVSDKRKKEQAIYLKIREAYLKTHPTCKAQLNGCTIQATDIHHKAGRIGDKLTDISNFLPVCRNCHKWVEVNPEQAKELNLSSSRLI